MQEVAVGVHGEDRRSVTKHRLYGLDGRPGAHRKRRRVEVSNDRRPLGSADREFAGRSGCRGSRGGGRPPVIGTTGGPRATGRSGANRNADRLARLPNASHATDRRRPLGLDRSHRSGRLRDRRRSQHQRGAVRKRQFLPHHAGSAAA
jgi:hypothetical protein